MTAKEYLSQYRALNARIDAKLEQAEHLRHLAQTAGGQSNSDGVRGTRLRDKVGELTAKIVDLEAEINKETDALISLERGIRSCIAQIPNENQRVVLELKYINGQTLAQIANKLNYSLVHIKRIHNQALKKMIPNDTF